MAADIERITYDAFELFAMRRQFREVAWMFEQNAELQRTGTLLWGWLLTMYWSAVFIRLRREVDNQPNAVSLKKLLQEVEERPDVVTRRRIVERARQISPHLAPVADEAFTMHWARPSATGDPDDQVNPDVVRADGLALKDAIAQLDTITSRTLAHRSRTPPPTTEVEGVDTMFQLVEDLLRKYLLLLTGTGLLGAEPIAPFDTIAPFTFPWHPTAYEEWKQRKGGA